MVRFLTHLVFVKLSFLVDLGILHHLAPDFSFLSFVNSSTLTDPR